MVNSRKNEMLRPIGIIILDEPYFIAMSSDLTGRLIIQSSDVFIANSFGVVFISCSMQQ